MKKQKKVNVAFLPIFLSVCILCLSIGYSAINSITGEITGRILALKQDGIFITDVKYDSSLNANPSASKINNYIQTTLNSNIVLSSSNGNSAITYAVTVYNSTNDNYRFNQVLYGDEFYDNPDIVYELTDLEKGDSLVSKGYLTFYITFSYLNDVVSDDHELNSYLNFEFVKDFKNNGNLELTYTINPAWDEGNIHYYRADFVLTNIGEEVVDYWNVVIPIGDGYKYSTGWGDGYIVDIVDDDTSVTVSSSEVLAIKGFVKFSIQFGVSDDNYDFDDFVITHTVASNNNGSGGGSTGDNPDNPDEPGEEIILTTSGIEIKLDNVNDWDSGNNNYYNQYNVTVTNTTDHVITDWQIAIAVPYGSAIEQIWNLQQDKGDSYVLIKAPAYNNSLQPGASYTEGGFILRVTHANFVPVLK